MIRNFVLKYNFPLKWIGIAFLIKIPLFIFFAFQFYHNWPADRIVNGIFIESGDTSGYYDPCEDFVNGFGYTSVCRMPGLLPIYAFLRLFSGIVWAKTLVIILQFLASTVSVYFLARIAEMSFKYKNIFRITFYLYALSSFVSIWAHFGYADTFGVAFLIFSIFYLLKYKRSSQLPHLVWAGIFVAWSVFFRPVHGLVLPILAVIYLVNFSQFFTMVKNIMVFSIPVVLCLGIWTTKNYKQTGKLIVLQGPLYECFPGITEELISIRHLIEAWGGDTQPWSANSAGEWFFAKKVPQPGVDALKEHNEITSAYNSDSLLLLRKKYTAMFSDSISPEEKNQLKHYVMFKSAVYTESYRHEKPFKYFFLNRIKLLKTLVFSNRLDNLPLPKFNDMKFYHKAVKGFYFLLMLAINFFGIIGCILALKHKNYLAIIPILFVLVLGAVLGYVEQRYIVPVYPFFVLYTAFLICHLKGLFLKNTAKDNFNTL